MSRPQQPQQHYQAQREIQAQNQTDQQAQQLANSGMMQQMLRNSEFVDDIVDPSIDREHDHADLEEKLSAEFGKHLTLGFIDDEEWESEKYMDMARAILTKQEFAPQTGPGSKCGGFVRQLMTGEQARPTLTPDRARQLEAAFEERSNARSLAINGRGFRGLTEATAVSRTEGLNGAGSNGGWMSRIKNALGG